MSLVSSAAAVVREHRFPASHQVLQRHPELSRGQERGLLFLKQKTNQKELEVNRRPSYFSADPEERAEQSGTWNREQLNFSLCYPDRN